MDDVLGVGHKALLGVGVGAAVIGGALAWALARGDDAPLPPTGDGHVDAKDAPNSAGSGIPATADGPANLAVAWWPQDISLAQQGRDATLRFQSTVVNLGGEPAPVGAGDHVEYVVTRSDLKGGLGEVVGRGSAPLGRGDLEPFPVDVGVEVGRPIESLGRTLQDIDSLAPLTAAIVGAGHPSQAITIRDAHAGHYTLRQQVVRADGSADAARVDDVRLTEFRLDGRGGILHLGSRYAS